MTFIRPSPVSSSKLGLWKDIASSSFFILQELDASSSSTSFLTSATTLLSSPSTLLWNFVPSPVSSYLASFTSSTPSTLPSPSSNATPASPTSPTSSSTSSSSASFSSFSHRILLKSRDSNANTLYLIASGHSLSEIIEDWRLVETVLFPQVSEWQVMGTLTNEKVLNLVQKLVDSFSPEDQVRAAKVKEEETEKLLARIQSKFPEAPLIAYFMTAYADGDQYPKKGKLALSQHHFFFLEDNPQGKFVAVPFINITYAKLSLLKIVFRVKEFSAQITLSGVSTDHQYFLIALCKVALRNLVLITEYRTTDKEMRQRINSDLSGSSLSPVPPSSIPTSTISSMTTTTNTTNTTTTNSLTKSKSFAIKQLSKKNQEEKEEDGETLLSHYSSNASFSNLISSIRSSLTSLNLTDPKEKEKEKEKEKKEELEKDPLASPIFLTEADIHTYLRLDRVSIFFHLKIQRLLGMFEAVYWCDSIASMDQFHNVNLYIAPDYILVAGQPDRSFPLQLILPFAEIVAFQKTFQLPKLMASFSLFFTSAYHIALRTKSGIQFCFSAYSQTEALYELLFASLKSVTLPLSSSLILKQEISSSTGPSTLPTPSLSLISNEIQTVSLNATFQLLNNAPIPRWQSTYPELLSMLPCLPLDEHLQKLISQTTSSPINSTSAPPLSLPPTPSKDPSNLSNPLKESITLGIPDDYRPKLWPLMARSLFVSNPKSYSYYVSLGFHPRFRDEIEKDIGRSLPEHPAFQSHIGCQALRRVLNAFAHKNPSIGYAQAMNLIASLLLLSVPEEDAFWILCKVVEEILPEHYSKTLIGSVTDQYVFERLLESYLPNLASYLKKLQTELSTITISWFVALFLSSLPFRLGQVVLDLFLLRKEVFLFQLALAFFYMNQPALLQAQDEFQVMDIFKRFLHQFQSNAEVFTPCPSQTASYLFRTTLVAAFQQFGSLRSSEIEKLRSECRFAATHRMEDDFRLSQLRTLREATKFQETELNFFYQQYQWILLTQNQPISGLNRFGFRSFFHSVFGWSNHTLTSPSSSSSILGSSLSSFYVFPLSDLMFDDACTQFHVPTLTLSSCVAQCQVLLKESTHTRLRFLFRLHDVDQDQHWNETEVHGFLFNLVWLLGGQAWDWEQLQSLLSSSLPNTSTSSKACLRPCTELVDAVLIFFEYIGMNSKSFSISVNSLSLKDNGIGTSNVPKEVVGGHSFPSSSTALSLSSPSSSFKIESDASSCLVPYHMYLMGLMSHPFIVKKLKLS